MILGEIVILVINVINSFAIKEDVTPKVEHLTIVYQLNASPTILAYTFW